MVLIDTELTVAFVGCIKVFVALSNDVAVVALDTMLVN